MSKKFLKFFNSVNLKYKIKRNKKNLKYSTIYRKTSSWFLGPYEIYMYFAMLRFLTLLLKK